VSHTKERTTDSAHKLYDALGGTLNEIFKWVENDQRIRLDLIYGNGASKNRGDCNGTNDWGRTVFQFFCRFMANFLVQDKRLFSLWRKITDVTHLRNFPYH
jgi:hypothetical protein